MNSPRDPAETAVVMAAAYRGKLGELRTHLDFLDLLHGPVAHDLSEIQYRDLFGGENDVVR